MGWSKKEEGFDHGMVGRERKEFGRGTTGRKEQMGDPVLVFSKTFQKGFQNVYKGSQQRYVDAISTRETI